MHKVYVFCFTMYTFLSTVYCFASLQKLDSIALKTLLHHL